jgi:hypothetical protein
MSDTPSALMRAILSDAVTKRASAQAGRVRITVVGKDDAAFIVEMKASGCAVIDDDDNDADADLWLAAADVPHLLKGFSLAGVRQAGNQALVHGLVELLDAGRSALAVRLGVRS